jgi:PAS domain S-box-containing protein
VDSEARMTKGIGKPRRDAIQRQSTEQANAKDHWPLHYDPEAQQNSLLLQAIIDSSDDAIISKDLNGTVTSWNRAAERMFGYSAAEIVGKSILTIVPPELQSDEPRFLSTIRAGERIDHFETVRCRKDGTRLNISLSISPVRDQSGNIIGAAKVARDITQQRIDQRAARHLAAVVESSDDGIISKDLNGFVTSWNPAAEHIFGYTAQEAIGRNILFLIPPELHGDEPIILGKIRAGERIEHFETIRLHKNGTRLDVSLTVSPILDGGKIVGASKIVRDVTRQRKMEAALHISERLASVGRLAATIAHEINNPLEAVTNFIYLARQAPDLPENVAEYLKVADHELARVAHVAQQTLGFYRDQTRPVHVDVAAAVDDVLTIYHSRISYKDLRVETRIEPSLRFYTLHGQLKQVLLNLVANAVDASHQSGRLAITARLRKAFRSGANVLSLTVADTGTGISLQDREKVFEPFYTTKKDVGTGLGLWITRDLLEKKGGHIRLRSRTGKKSGTAMTVFLPEEAHASAEETAA